MPLRISISVICALALIAMACGISINVPIDQVVTGQTVHEDIFIPIPPEENIELDLSFGAGEFDLSGGSINALVEGTATYNVADFKPKIETVGNRVTVRTGDLELKGIPKIDDEVKNRWDLRLGAAPMELKISAGAFEGDFDLGGVALKSLEIDGGASDVRLDFSAPNPIDMEMFRYSTGASNVRLTGLANANFENMVFRSGLGDFTLDFTGNLRRDADVTVESGVSRVSIVVPREMQVRLVVTGALTNVDISGGWVQTGNEYFLGEGVGPVLTIHVEMGAGDLQLRTT